MYRFSISFEIEKQFKLRLKFNLILDWTTISSSRTYSYYHTGIWDCFTILFCIVFRSHLSLKINLLSNRFSTKGAIENRFASHLKVDSNDVKKIFVILLLYHSVMNNAIICTIIFVKNDQKILLKKSRCYGFCRKFKN